MENLIIWLIGASAFFCLLYLRVHVVIEEWKTWNYYVYRYRNYAMIEYSGKTPGGSSLTDIDKNLVSKWECFLVIISIWKFSPHMFFDDKPDWVEINDRYYLKKL